MNKKEILQSLVKKTKVKKSDCKKVLESFFDVVKGRLFLGESVVIKNFGVFKTKFVKQKIGFNPYLKRAEIFMAKRVPLFKPCAKLKDVVNN